MKAPKFEKELTFLVPYIFDEESRYSNIVPPSLHSAESSSDVDETEAFVEAQTQSADETLSSVTTASTSNSQKRKHFTEPPSAAGVLKDYLNTRKNTTQQTQEKDPLTAFFTTMADTVRGFPIMDQLEIKAKIFKMVNSVEIKLATDIEKQKTVIPKTLNSSESTGTYERYNQVQDRISKLPQNRVVVQPQKVIPLQYDHDYDILELEEESYEQPITYFNLD